MAHILILRMARLDFGLNKVNMPTKPPVCSLVAYICPVLIAQATLFYTDVLFNKQTPAFNQLAEMKPPKGYLAAKKSCWCRPWIKAAPPNIPLASSQMPVAKGQGAGDSNCPVLTDIEDDPVVRMAGAKQPTAVSKSKQQKRQC